MDRLDVSVMFLEGPYRKIEPASAAIVMAIGIFLIGTIEAFPILNEYLGKFFAFILLIIWVIIYGFLTFQFFHRDFIIPFIKHPVNSFTMGTWIAGVSVLCNVFLDYFPSIIKLTRMMVILNSLLWVFFLIICIYNFKKLLLDNHEYKIHGVLLLSTVGTQSIIVLINNVFFQIPVVFSEIMILIGLVFYVFGIYLITVWVIQKKKWTLTDDWSTTNCIIHGALSITGFAIITTNTFNSLTVNLLWMITFILLIIVECVELLRIKKRIQKYGLSKGIFSYHITQWSRNFTFGMFYTFTLVMHENTKYFLSEKLYIFQASFMSIWAWVVLIVLIIEIIIFLNHFMNRRTSLNRTTRT